MAAANLGFTNESRVTEFSKLANRAVVPPNRSHFVSFADGGRFGGRGRGASR